MADPLEIMNQIGAAMSQMQGAAPNKRKEMLDKMTGGEKDKQDSGMKIPMKKVSKAPLPTTPMQQPANLQTPFSSSLAAGKIAVA